MKVLAHFVGCMTLAAAILAGGGNVAQAHDVWLMSEGTGAGTRLSVFYGHPPGDISRPDAGRLFALDLVTAKGSRSILDAIAKGGDKPVLVTAPLVTGALGAGAAGGVVAARYDNGFWSRVGKSSVNTIRVNKPETDRVMWSQKVSKILLPGGSGDTRALGHPLEIVPLASPWASGKALRVKVLFDGKPLADEDIMVGDGATEKATSVTTDAAGIATVPLAEGRWYVLSVGHTVKSRVPAIADIDAYVATLSFRM